MPSRNPEDFLFHKKKGATGPAEEVLMDIRVRKATLADLEQLGSFAVGKANEAEGGCKPAQKT